MVAANYPGEFGGQVVKAIWGASREEWSQMVRITYQESTRRSGRQVILGSSQRDEVERQSESMAMMKHKESRRIAG